MRIALAQINPTVGDLAGNLKKHLGAMERARGEGAKVVMFPEMSIIGYPPKDLLLKPAVIERAWQAVERVAEQARGMTVLVGYPERNTAAAGRALRNAVAVVRDGRVVGKRFKSLLPTYDVFDEGRYFEPAERGEMALTEIDGQAVGVSICEDLWNDERFVERPLYHFNPIEALAEAGARVLLNISASPFVLGKNAYRGKLFSHQARRWGMPLLYVNQVGGNDELVFDGNSAAFDARGEVVARAKDFAEDLMVVEVEGKGEGGRLNAQRPTGNAERGAVPREGIASVHAALVLGLRDYMGKCGFKTAVLGVSGGIDSAVVAALAAEALGPGNVTGVALPSRYSSGHSVSDAEVLARNLGIHYRVVALEEAHRAMERTLAPLAGGLPPGLAEENVQARLRGNILMWISNKFGHLLLTTGNKSEVAVGYCTLYGDMCGGLALISDVPKMMVYELARHINAEAARAGRAATGGGPIPENSITKPPSAELRPNQTDQDSLPAYEVLDAIIEQYVEEEKSVGEIIGAGFEAATVERVARLIDVAEYKRKQMAPGIKVTSRAFGFGRRMPIAQGWDAKLAGL